MNVKILIAVAFNFVCFSAISLPQQTNSNAKINDKKYYVSDLQKNVDILHYYLKLNLKPDEKLLTGTATITAIFSEPNPGNKPESNIKLLPEINNQHLSGFQQKEIELNLYDNLTVKKVLLNDQPAEYSRNKNRIFIKTEKEISDTFKINIAYEGTPQRGGFDGFVFGEVKGNSLIYNISEPNFASTWFPCDDDPADKAFLDIEITNDSQYVSVSNGLLKSVSISGDKKTYHYQTLYPISTYLIAVYSALYQTFADVYNGLYGKDSMKIEYYVMPEHLEKARIDFGNHLDMMKTLSKLFGEYPFIKEKYGVAEFLWNYGAMENQTITGIGYVFVSGNNFFEDTYVHELAHHWWGNSVGLKSWNDIWLNEGFATYSEALYAEAKNGKDALKSKMLSKFSDNFRGTLYAPKDLFGETVYDKGAWVLHMLRIEIGDSSFFKSLHKYYDTYKYSNASVQDFKNVCENVSGINLDKFFDQWVFTGTENIDCSYTLAFPYDGSNKKCTISINQNSRDYKEFHFPLDIKFNFVDGSSAVQKVYIDEINKRFNFSFENKIETIDIDPDFKLLGRFEKAN
ncbi:MAG TPA: hypothetical protein DHV28_14685 [Ignavibacteriales bacterium]|nr:hypothetical protein [Ignavibacteriales bacterium]